MKNGKAYFFSKLFLCLVFSQSLTPAQDTGIDPAIRLAGSEVSKSQITEESLIHFGDLLEIDVIGSFEYDWRGTLSPEGFLNNVQFLDEPVYGLCKSEADISEKLAAQFGKFLREPKIAVKILDRTNRPTAMLSGAVKKPQRFQIKRRVQLNELLIISGGLTDQASGEIQIFRPQKLNCLEEAAKRNDLPLENSESSEIMVAAREKTAGPQFINIKISDLLSGKVEANPQILSGDIVTILEAQPIYVIGGVEYPKQVSSRAQMTLLRAITSAGGLSKDADERKITIFRRKGGETEIIEADLEKIKADLSEDIPLQAFDIVEIARRGKKARNNSPVLENFDPVDQDKLKLPLRIID